MLAKLAQAALQGDIALARKTAEEVIAANIDITKAIREGFGQGMTEIGQKFASCEVYLPELMRAAEAMNAGLAVLRPKLMEKKGTEALKGKIIIGTVFGDIHDVGRNLVSTFLQIAGYEVFDLGHSVHDKDFVRKAEEVNADIIALSCLISPSMYYQRDVIRLLKAMGIRERYYVIVGGGPITPEWAEQIESDGYGKYAEDAVELCNRLMEFRKPQGKAKPIVVGL